MSQIKIKYDTSAVVLPGKLLDVIDRASAVDLKLLLCLCAAPELCQTYGGEDWIQRAAELADCDADAVQASLAFWRGAGLLVIEDASKGPKKKKSAADPVVAPQKTEPIATTTTERPTDEPKEKTVKLRSKAELPHYSAEQLAELLASRSDTVEWLNECQRIFGKVFNTLEVNTILGFVDYLGLEWEYVLCLLSYYVSLQERRGMPKSLRGAEKMAFDFYDQGIQTIGALQEEIRRLSLLAETEGKLRTLFGMGERSLTPKEKKCFSAWLYEYGYGMDIIRMAYDITVDAKGSPNISYMNSVLANWNKEGLRTPKDIQAANEAHKSATTAKGARTNQRPDSEQSSFDVDDFFAAAVRRSLGEDTPPEFQKKDQ